MVDGVPQLNKLLTKTIPARVNQAARDAMEKGANELVAMMRSFVPVQSGALRESIGWTWGKAPKDSTEIATSEGDEKGNRITIYAGNSKTMVGSRNQFQLARLQEFGTVAMRSNPFFFPAWRTLRTRIRSRITREIKKAIRASSAE